MSGVRQRIVLIASTGCFLSIGLLVPALPQYLTGPLKHGTGLVGIMVAVPSVTAIVVRPVLGRITDRCGFRWVTVAGAATLALASLALVGADSFPALLVCRAAAGVGEACCYVGLAAASLADGTSETAQTARSVSWFSVAVYLGLLAGAPLGALIVTDGGFTEVWLLSAAVAGGTAALCLAVPSRPLPTDGTMPVQAAASPDGTMPKRGRASLIHRAGLVPGFAYAGSMWGYTAFNTFIPIYVVTVGERDARVEYVLYGAVLLGLRTFGNRLTGRIQPRKAAIASLALTALGLATIAAIPTDAGLICGTASLALGQALGLPAFLTMVVSTVPSQERGSAIATVTAFFDIGFLTASLGLGLTTQGLGLRTGFGLAALVAASPLLLLTARRNPAAKPLAQTPHE